MHPYVLLSLAASLSAAMLAVGIHTRDSTHAANRAAARLLLGVAFWAACEVVWNTADDPETVLALVKLSALGWVALGPLALHVFAELSPRPLPRLRALLPALYGVSGVFLAIDWLTPWIHPSVARSDWGWSYALASGYVPFYLFTMACALTALVIGGWDFRQAAPAERRQLGWLLPGIVTPLAVASLTDGLLPLMGIQWPRLGTASFAVLGASIAWSLHRHGFTLLAPGDFAREILDILPAGVALLRNDGCIRTANVELGRMLGRPVEALPGLRVLERLWGAPSITGESFAESECELRVEQGGTIPVSASASKLLDKQGLPIGTVLVVRDLREVADLRSQLVLSGRMAAVGQLAAGVAHEINNPVTYVRANLGTLRELLAKLASKLPATSADAVEIAEGEQLVEEALEGVDRVAGIVRDVKSFSHGGNGKRTFVDLGSLLDQAIRMAGPTMPGVLVEKHYGRLPRVEGSGQELLQVFLNLLVNAGQAVDSSGRVCVEAASDADSIWVEVVDDGPGMSGEVLERVFDPFFTTKEVGVGTGLGLAISYQILRNHGGQISARSLPGGGSCFRVVLPLSDAPDDDEPTLS